MGTGSMGYTPGTGKDIATQEITEDGITKQVERVAQGVGVLTLPGSADVTAQSAVADYPASAITIEGKARIVLKSTFSNNTAVAVIRILWLDSADVVIGYSEPMIIGNTAISDGGGTPRYYGTPVVIANELGASKFKIHLEQTVTDSGDISFWGAYL